mmetsp:Transcript_95460/g.169495  ORF Transcript_95460/g.169495 Transcript_95460/m.169495 type:complete len:123 (-) Transcript_95460:115-483(-)
MAMKSFAMLFLLSLLLAVILGLQGCSSVTDIIDQASDFAGNLTQDAADMACSQTKVDECGDTMVAADLPNTSVACTVISTFTQCVKDSGAVCCTLGQAAVDDAIASMSANCTGDDAIINACA